MADALFSQLSDDIVLNIFSKLEGDPRNWARLACVCTKFSSLIRNICWKSKCSALSPSVVADLGSSVPPGGWSSLFKLSVCCPGLLHAGVLLENSDFGLERELGPDENYPRLNSDSQSNFNSLLSTDACSSHCGRSSDNNGDNNCNLDVAGMANECSWSLFDDLYYDTMYNASEAHDGVVDVCGDGGGGDGVSKVENGNRREVVKVGKERDFNVCKRRRISRSMRSHLASGSRNLSREQGIKLLASRFRGDSLYICDWPGCLHIESKRNYMLFRGIFKNFKRSRVWRTINDGNRSKIDLNCAFCPCKETWDLHSAFCLRRVFGFHDDGEPVVRAYVCENGHVSGAWTDLPLYT